jgi:hypothetical protein
MKNLLRLRGLAETIAAECSDKGTIVITLGEEGIIRIGTEGFTPTELREALCTAIHYSYVFEG